MPDPRRLYGTQMETEAARFLEQKGFRILHHQYRTPFGEIDLVCQEGDEIVFVEVKARQSGTYGYPEESVGPQKLKHLVRSALAFMQTQPSEQFWRIDVIAMETGPKTQITHIKAVDIPDRF